MSKLSLNGSWQMRELVGKVSGGSKDRRRFAEWRTARVPGCVHQDLLAAKLIPDPNYRTNELDLQWLDEADWEYRRTLRATPAQAAAALQQLVFEGLDTIAEVYLNERLVGRGENMFRRYRFDVAGVLRAGENELRVVLRSPTRWACRQAAKSASHLLPTDFNSWALRPPRRTCRTAIRKAQYQFGWDWGICLTTSGIWQDCYLLATNEPVFDYVTTQQHHDAGRARLTVTGHLIAPAARASSASTAPANIRGTMCVTIDKQTVDVPAKLKAGKPNQVTAEVVIAAPRLWWPAGQGGQPLYDLKVEWLPELRSSPKSLTAGSTARKTAAIASDTFASRLGLRKVELVQEPDADGRGGRSFKFRLNGRDVYCKGGNWIPDDVLPTRTSAARLRLLLESCVAANMNMLRVWGGGIYASEEFLALCDELGIMLWHDFMFACGAYPEERPFLDNVAAEMRHQVRRMINHASIVLWCGNNENQTAIDAWWSGHPRHKELRRAYDRLTYDTQERVVLAEDPGRPWWPSSPSGYPREETTRPFGWDKTGDMHDWSVWHRRQNFDYYYTTRPRFASEFGFQSFPPIETLAEVARPEDLNVSSPVMDHHQRHGSGNSIITDFLMREFRFPPQFADFCYLSQVNHARAMKIAIEHWRRLKPHCMGTLYWQVNDDWQVASWAGIDWSLRWKALHYVARRFFAPLLGTVTDDAAGLRLWATSDVAAPLGARWTVEAWTFDGRRIWRREGAARLKANESRAVVKLPKDEIMALAAKAAGRAAGAKSAASGGAVDKASALVAAQRQVFLVTTLRAGGEIAGQVSVNQHLFAPLKHIELPKCRVKTTVCEVRGAGAGRSSRRSGGAALAIGESGQLFEVTLTTDAPAFHVQLSTGPLGGAFSDNIMTLLPGRPTKVQWRPYRPTTLAALRKSLKVRSVRDTY